MKIFVTLLFMAFAAAAQAQTFKLTQDTSVKLEAKTYFDTVDVQPAFKGNLGEYLVKNLKVPAGTKFPPKITTQMWIDTLGRITHVEILDKTARAPVTPLEKEVVRVVKNMPRWEPGRYNGKKVTVKYSLPIVF
jgi:protein TonB